MYYPHYNQLHVCVYYFTHKKLVLFYWCFRSHLGFIVSAVPYLPHHVHYRDWYFIVTGLWGCGGFRLLIPRSSFPVIRVDLAGRCWQNTSCLCHNGLAEYPLAPCCNTKPKGSNCLLENCFQRLPFDFAQQHTQRRSLRRLWNQFTPAPPASSANSADIIKPHPLSSNIQDTI